MSERLRCAICGRFVSGEFGKFITPDSEFTHEEIEHYCKNCVEKSDPVE